MTAALQTVEVYKAKISATDQNIAAPRTITEQQKNKLIGLLLKFKDAQSNVITICALAQVADSQSYGYQFNEIFIEAGWVCNLRQITNHKHTDGIWLCGEGIKPSHEILLDQFKKANINIQSDPTVDYGFNIIIGYPSVLN